MPEPTNVDDRLYEQAGHEAQEREQALVRNPWFTCAQCGARFHFREHHWCGPVKADA